MWRPVASVGATWWTTGWYGRPAPAIPRRTHQRDGSLGKADVSTPPLELHVLGPVEARLGGQPASLGGVRPQTLIAALALGGEIVSSGRLVEEVWRSDPPPSATATLQSYLSRLRRILGRDRVLRHPGGYALVIGEELDANRFEVRLRQARQARDAGDLRDASAGYGDALACWRGDVAEGLDAGPIIREASARLLEHRLLALEERIEVELTSGRHHEVIGDLEALTAGHPHRERLHAQRLVALYRAGRQADALAAYRQARAALVDGLGIEPGPQLRELQQRILDQDPALGVHAPEMPAAVVVHPAAPGGPATPATAGRSVAPDGPRGEGASDTSNGSELPTASDSVGPSDAPGEARPGNLPAPLGSFIGRVGTRREIAARLAGDARLITLVGAGGCGKTQLALRAASDAAAGYTDGVWWVELAAHRDPELVERAVADAIGLPASRQAPRFERVATRLGEGRHLLVLDNCEHLVDACADLVAELLRRCPRLRILATSREPLDVEGEATWRVPSLQLPPPGATSEQILASEAAQLFMVRARVANPDVDLEPRDASIVARVCRELDGIPLALELAAARLNVLSLHELAERLSDRFRVLGSGRRSAPARHRTLDAAIAWSYELLDPQEQLLLARLSVFAGGFTVDDAEAVCSGPAVSDAPSMRSGDVEAPPNRAGVEDPDTVADGDVVGLLGALLAKSLVQGRTGPTGRARHDLLGTVRSFAAARLAAPEARELADRHARRFADLAERSAPRLTGPDQVEWLNRLHAEQDNLRVVLRRGGREAARIAASVWWFWLQFGHTGEGDRWVAASLATGDGLDPALRRELHRGAARLAAAVDDPGRARPHLEVALELAEQTGHVASLPEDQGLLARLAAARGDHARAADHLHVARRQAVDAGEWVAAAVEHHAAEVAWLAGELEVAALAAAAAEQGYQRAGDGWSACLARLGAARVAQQLGDLEVAIDLHRTNLARGLDLTVSSLDFVGLPQDLQDLAGLAAELGRHRLAVTLVGAAAAVRTAVELHGGTSERQAEVLTAAATVLGADEVEVLYAASRSRPAADAVHRALEATAALTTAG